MTKQWQNSIIGYGEEAPEQLLASPYNPRRHDRFQQEIMQEMIEEVGVIQDVIVNRRTGHLVDGHMRVMIAMRTGQKTIPVKYVDLTLEQEKVAIATLDAITGLADANADAFEDLVNSIDTDSEALYGFIESLLDSGGRPRDENTAGDDLTPSRATPTLTWGRNLTRMTAEELDLMRNRIDEYEAEHGKSAGFVSHLLEGKTL